MAGAGSKEKREKGISSYSKNGQLFWRIDIWLELPDGSRRRKQVSSIPNIFLARKLRDKLMADSFEGRNFERPKAAMLTVREAWKNYLPVTTRKNRSWKHDEDRAAHFLRHLGDKRAAQLTQADVDAYRTKREAETTVRKTAPKASTLNREIALMRHVLNYAVKRRDLPRNPLAGVEMLHEDNVRQVAVDEASFARLYASADDELKPILVTAFETGMRCGEILALRWDQVDLKSGTIRLAPSDTKSKKPRIIIITDRVRAELEVLPRSISGYVFVNRATGTRWYDLKKVFARARTDAGLPHIWFHDLRRSFVTNARRRGVPESVVMKMSGHKTRTVFERYNVIDEEDLRDAVHRLEKGREEELAAVASGGK